MKNFIISYAVGYFISLCIMTYQESRSENPNSPNIVVVCSLLTAIPFGIIGWIMLTGGLAGGLKLILAIILGVFFLVLGGPGGAGTDF
jgi:hypothetical protein